MKMKPSYKANNAKYCKTYQNKNINNIRKRDKDRKQITKEYLKYCDTEKYKEQKRKDREKKIGKRREGKRGSCSSINGPKSRIHQYTINDIETQTNEFSFFKKGR